VPAPRDEMDLRDARTDDGSRHQTEKGPDHERVALVDIFVVLPIVVGVWGIDWAVDRGVRLELA
jgi:hypothetical protein